MSADPSLSPPPPSLSLVLCGTARGGVLSRDAAPFMTGGRKTKTTARRRTTCVSRGCASPCALALWPLQRFERQTRASEQSWQPAALPLLPLPPLRSHVCPAQDCPALSSIAPFLFGARHTALGGRNRLHAPPTTNHLLLPPSPPLFPSPFRVSLSPSPRLAVAILPSPSCLARHLPSPRLSPLARAAGSSRTS